MSTTELALRHVPVPSFLEEVGVRFAYDEASNARLILIPPNVRDKVNVIDPVTSLVQADPNWTPRISLIQLDSSADGAHFYNQGTPQTPKLAPTKQALETIGKAIGILETKTERILKAELDEGEIGYRATIKLRKSDGSIETLSRDRIWNGEVEKEKIEGDVDRMVQWENGQRTNKPKYEAGSPARAAEVRKRWLKELEDRNAKTESKAINRAIRAAAQIPHTFTAEQARKPFLCVGFNFTPDYSDAETKRALVAAGLNAQASLYSGSAPPLGAVDQEPVAVATSPPAQVAATAPESTVEQEPTNDGETGYNLPQEIQAQLQDAADAAAKTVPPNGVHAEAGRTLAQILALGPDGARWLGMALRKAELPEAFRKSLVDFTRIYATELHDAVVAEREASL